MRVKDINLKDQLLEVKDKWYYQDYKWVLKTNKHSVVFDNDFKFKLVNLDLDENDHGVVVRFYINDKYDELLGYFSEDKYADDPKDILETILLFIANRI